MHVKTLCRYTRLGASSRLRTLLYRPYIERAGAGVDYCSYFDDAYLRQLSAGNRRSLREFRHVLRRLRDLRAAKDADLLWIEKEALPWLPWAAERFFLPSRVPFAVDFDDAVFHRYDLNRSAFVRWLLGTKLDRLMAASTLVTAGNAYLADRAIRAGAPWVEIVPTVVDIEIYSPSRKDRSSVVPVIGWIGSPSTWDEYMVPAIPLLTEVAQAEKARVKVVGASVRGGNHPLMDRLPWAERSEVLVIQDMDIGIMPLTDTPWAKGKCGYKLIQYMACGLPVIASPVGVNTEIIEDGVNGFLAETEAEWRVALTRLLRDPALRQRMGQAGRAKVEAEYSLQIWGPRLAEMLLRAARGAAP